MQFEKAKSFILDKLMKELPGHLSYHSVEHIMDVYEACKSYAQLEGINEEETTLLLTAALFHDSGFLKQQEEHERISCDYAREYLPQFEYSAEQVERICGMIMATRIPQTPTNKLEQIICDADLDYLGRDDFFSIGDRLFSELSIYGMLNTEDEWNRLQVRFLENHQYFTETAIKLRKQKKDEHLNTIREKIGAGNNETVTGK